MSIFRDVIYACIEHRGVERQQETKEIGTRDGDVSMVANLKPSTIRAPQVYPSYID